MSEAGSESTIVSRIRRKILTHEALLSMRMELKAQGKAFVQCHGCFDIVHPGHIRHLRFAKAQGDVLLVSITGDLSIGKGEGRPLIPEELRAENLAALDFVDWVYIEPTPTASELLGQVKPDVYIKGREYEFNHDPRFTAEQRAVEDGGGRVVFSSGDVVFSSTALIASMEQSVDPNSQRISQLTGTEALQGEALYGLISSFRDKRVLVVGETILDTYVLCDQPEVAGESPVMTLRPLERRRYVGGAGIIARHIAAMGARPILLTPMADDELSRDVSQQLTAEGVEVHSFEVAGAITEKQRFLVGAQKVMKLDLVEPMVLDAARVGAFVDLASDLAARCRCHGAVIADFGQGLFSSSLLQRVCGGLRQLVDVMAGDVSGRRSSLSAMRNMDLVCPSELELREAFRLYDEGLPLVAWKFMEATKCKSAIVTMGSEGLIAFDRMGQSVGHGDGWDSRLKAEYVPALCGHAVDALGCGDSLIAAATLGLISHGGLLPSTFLGAVSAAVQAQRIGNTPISATDLRRGVVKIHASHMTYAEPEFAMGRGGKSFAADAVVMR